ncbi:hypothetical protein ABLN67_09755 [Mycobacterium tuberculosis]
MFNRFIYRREWSFRIYRETLSRFSCAASSVGLVVIGLDHQDLRFHAGLRKVTV